MKKSGAFLLVAFLIVAIIGIVTYSILVFKAGEEKPMLAPVYIDFPYSCSDVEIRAVWDSVFAVSSDNLYISTNSTVNGSCNAFYAYKNISNETYALGGYATYDNSGLTGPYTELNVSEVFYFYGNLTFVDTEALMLPPDTVGDPFFLFALLGISSYFELSSHNWTQIPIVPNQKHATQFDYVNGSVYIWSSPYWTVEEASYSNEYLGGNRSLEINLTSIASVHGFNQTMGYVGTSARGIRCDPNWLCSGWGTCNGTVQTRTCSDQKNCGILYGRPALTQSCSPACVPNWTAVQATPCNATESFVIWYNDTNRCQNVTAPGNITGYCDYDGNGLIGRLSDIVDDNLDIDILKIDDKVVNYSKNYTGDEDVELIEDEDDVEIVRVKFKYDFDDEPLNLKTIRIEKQDEDSDFGYLIVEGLDVDNKDFRVDKVYHSNAVCVKDDGLIDDPSDIDEFCGGDDEYDVACPGIRSEFNCTDGGDGTYLVRGMDHSGVRELEDSITSPPPPGNQTNQTCQAIWDCGLWGQCANGVQRRVCTDLSSCPNATKSYNQTQACTGDCTPDWECGAWTPTDCEAGEEQTQVCVDLNGCSDDETRNRECSEEGGIDWLLIGIIIGAGVIVLAAVILIIIVKRRRDAREAEEKNSPIQTLQRPPAGSYNPTHYGMYGGYGYRR